jgi:hypothetical protein
MQALLVELVGVILSHIQPIKAIISYTKVEDTNQV